MSPDAPAPPKPFLERLKSLPSAAALLAVAAIVLFGVFLLDRPLSSHTRIERLRNEYEDVTAALELVEARQADVEAELARAASAGGSTGPAGKSDVPSHGSTALTPAGSVRSSDGARPLSQHEEGQYRALLISERVGLARQKQELTKRQERVRKRLASAGVALTPDTTPGLVGHLRDSATYLAAAFHTMVLGVIGFAYGAIGTALLLVLGKFANVEVKDIVDFAKAHAPKLVTSSSAAPMLAVLAGAGGLTVGASAASMVNTNSSFSHIHGPSVTVDASSRLVWHETRPTTAPPAFDPHRHAWVVQPVIERFREPATKPSEGAERPVTVQVKGEVVVHGQATSMKALESKVESMQRSLTTLAEHAADIRTHTAATETAVGRVNTAVTTVGSTLTKVEMSLAPLPARLDGLDSKAQQLVTSAQQAADADVWLANWEYEKASGGFTNQMKGIFGWRHPRACPPLPSGAGCPRTRLAKQ